MRQLLYEQKIMGINAIWIFASLIAAFTLLAYFGGELLNLSNIGFEVVFPFLIAIAVGEWGKTRSDTSFDIIVAQSNSLFRWIILRSTTVFITGSLFAFINMVIVSYIRNEMPLWEMVLLYLSPAFFLSTVCVLCGICFSEEHAATLICGILWILTILARSLLPIPGVQFVYLFIHYAGDMNGIWLINKGIITLIGLVLWIGIYVISKKRVFIK